MVEEKNHKTLKRTIARLGAYEPPEALWDAIEGDLEDTPIHERLEGLPSYDPPESVWDAIQTSMEARPEAPRRVSALSRRQWIGIAAGIALLLFALIRLDVPGPANEPEVSINYSEESVPVPVSGMAEEDVEMDFNAVLQLFEQQPYLRQLVDFDRLRGELDELASARRSVMEALQRYGGDDRLQRQLGRIERDRSDILKELASAI